MGDFFVINHHGYQRMHGEKCNFLIGIEIARALAQSGFKLVPDIVAGGDSDGGGAGSLVSVLIANLIRDGLSKTPNEKAAKPEKK